MRKKTVESSRGIGVLVLAMLLAVSVPSWAQSPASLGTGIAITPDVVYGHKDGMALTFDVFRPQRPNGAATLHIVSGGWISRYFEPNALPPREAQMYRTLLDRGFTVFAVRHGASPRYNIPEIVPDVRRAVRFIKMTAAQYGINPDRLGVFGMSAGGHLSLMLGTASDTGAAADEDKVLRVGNRVAAVVAFYPPVDLRPAANAVVTERPSKRYPALNFEDSLYDDFSPLDHVTADDPPTLLMHGDADKLVPPVQSELIYRAFQQSQVTTDRLVFPGAGHGFEGADYDRAVQATADWFTRHLAPPNGATR